MPRLWSMFFGVLLLWQFVDARGVELVEEGCGFLWKVDGGAPELVEVPNLNILETSAEQDALTFDTDERIEVVAVVCWRNSVLPAENDYKVVDAGPSLYLKMSDETESRTTVLEKSGGRYRVRLLDGDPLTDSERDEIVRTLQRFEGSEE